MAPTLIQSATGTGTASPVAVTLGVNTTAGNCLIVATGGVTTVGNNPAVTGITLGGAAGNFAQSVTAGVPASDASTVSVWADPGCTGGQTALSVSLSFGGTPAITVIAMEWAGIAYPSAADQSSGAANNTSAVQFFSSGLVTAAASELGIGIVCTPSGGTWNRIPIMWNLFPILRQGVNGILVGWTTSSTGRLEYNGQTNTSYSVAVATFQAANVAVPGIQMPNRPYAQAFRAGGGGL